MKVLYVADGRSPIAQNWINYFIQSGHEIYLVTTFPCQPIDGVSWQVEVPVALSGFYNPRDDGGDKQRRMLYRFLPVEIRTKIRQLAAPYSFPRAGSALQEVIENFKPDLIHAMRIPYEGMISVTALDRIRRKYQSFKHMPLLVSVWGNDFTLHARSTRAMSAYTNRVLQMVDGLHTDCQRDMHLAMKLGFDVEKPNIVLPGNGGVKMDIFYPPDRSNDEPDKYSMAENRLVTIINPRGYRAYVRNDTFFRASKLVLMQYPNAHFVCPEMSSETQAIKWISKLGINQNVELLPHQSLQQMSALFRKSQISLSITTHDGTPNTLLEAMACGCFPIAGDIDSIHEWISTGRNGLLVDPSDYQALADAIMQVVVEPELRKQAMIHNLELVKERAEYGKVMLRAEEFYERMITGK